MATIVKKKLLVNMSNYHFLKKRRTLIFFLATLGVAFLIDLSLIKPKAPKADVAEANLFDEVKAASAIKDSQKEKLASIPDALMTEPRVVPGSFMADEPKELLDQLGIVYDEKAIILEVGIPAKYRVGYNDIVILDPQKVFYDIGGTQGTTTTWAKNVQELIEQIKQEQKIDIGQSDIVEPARETELKRSELFSLKVTPVEETEVVEKEMIPFKTIRETDPELLKGKKIVQQVGAKGIKEYQYKLVRHKVNDKWQVAERKLLATKITKEPLDEKIVIGSKVELYGTGKATFYDSVVAAHKTLPFGTMVDVVNLENGKTTRVKIGDRGPFAPGRVIDLPKNAFAEISSIGQGLIDVKLEKVAE